jgi:hypothetical protein
VESSMLMRALLRFAATRVSVPTYERLLAHSVLKDNFNSLESIPVYKNREAMWPICFTDDPITYIEFGVHTGHSISHFAKNNSNPSSRFIGLDSFEGLPEDWGSMQKGTFDVRGAIPRIDDPRVSFVKGWFQNTWDELKSRLGRLDNLIVHYDADLYSSTLFALTKIDSLSVPYTAIFDEFAGHEARALHNYIQAYSATVKFLGKTVVHDYPVNVISEIRPAVITQNVMVMPRVPLKAG